VLANRVRMATFKDSFFIPEGYVLATDDDFSGTYNGSFRYIGTALAVVIPNKIKGIAVTNYANMFNSDTGKLVEGVVSYNKNIISTSRMFYSSQATSLDLSNFDTSSVIAMNEMFRDSKATSLDVSSFDTSNVTAMNTMFYGSQATTLDLSSFDTSNVTNMSGMFQGSRVTTGYARTQADADRFNNSSGKPSTLVFVVK